MADERLLQVLDFILNHSDESSIQVIAEAVVRRRRNLSMFNVIGEIPDPAQAAKDISAGLTGSTDKIMDSMRASIHDMIVRLVREHAPELDDKQINELCDEWMPKQGTVKKSKVPSDALLSMVEQFISFSHGTMNETVDQKLREEMGAWPERYWNSFPPVVRQLISDYLKDKLTDKDFKSKIVVALGL
ncbi:MAG: hypothetical protein FWB73_07870 [Treponema sp.]|nr:hypothetical protein [Treponema sp.]